MQKLCLNAEKKNPHLTSKEDMKDWRNDQTVYSIDTKSQWWPTAIKIFRWICLYDTTWFKNVINPLNTAYI